MIRRGVAQNVGGREGVGVVESEQGYFYAELRVYVSAQNFSMVKKVKSLTFEMR